MNATETPVLLLTGYLGSGKTTLLNRMLSNQQGIRFAVIVNDIGEVNIDAGLIEKGGIVGQEDDSLVPLQNGCICCTLKMDLVKQLSDLAKSRKFDYIVIEASGICEPAPIAQTISVYPEIYPELAREGACRLDCIATVVDALRMQDEFENGVDLTRQNLDEDDLASLVIQQVEFCNVILLNKASEVSTENLAKITGILRAIQPKAEIIPCDYGDVDFAKLLNTNHFDFEKVASSPAWVAAIEEEEDHLENEESGEALEYNIQTFVYQSRKPFNLGRFDDYVARLWPKNIIRSKGLCYFADERQTCYVFEQAGRQVQIKSSGQWFATMPKEDLEQFLENNPRVRKDWDEKYGDRINKLVFIGQDLDKEAITKALDDCTED